jgi:hypothetical protein
MAMWGRNMLWTIGECNERLKRSHNHVTLRSHGKWENVIYCKYKYKYFITTNKTNSVEFSVRELHRPSVRRVSAKLVPTFPCRGCHVVSVTDPHGRILGFPDRSRYFLFQVALQLYLRGWVNPVQDPLLLRTSGSAGNRTRTSEAIYFILHNTYKLSSYLTENNTSLFCSQEL